MHLEVEIHLKKLEAVIMDEASGDDPYLWVFFMTLDGGTVKQLPGTTRLVGQVKVQSGPGGHENLGVDDIETLKPIAIPDAIGRYRTTLGPIRVDVDRQTIFLPGRIVTVVILTEEDEAPPSTVIKNAHESVRQLIELRINDFVNTLDLQALGEEALLRIAASGGTIATQAEAIVNERIAALIADLRSRARETIELEFLLWHTPGAFWELFAFVDTDDFIDSHTFRFNERRLIQENVGLPRGLPTSLKRVDDGTIEVLYDLDGRIDANLKVGSNDLTQTGETVETTVFSSGTHVFEESRLCIAPGDRAEWTIFAQREMETYLFNYPFIEPIWKVDGQELSGSSGTITLIATAAIPFFNPKTPGRAGRTSGPRAVTVMFTKFREGQLHGIRLTNNPADGNWGVPFELFVKPPMLRFPIRVAATTLYFAGLSLESPFYAAFGKCMEKFSRISEIYAKSIRIGPKELWGPSARIKQFEEQIQLGREAVDAGLMTESRFERARAALAKRLKIGRISN